MKNKKIFVPDEEENEEDLEDEDNEEQEIKIPEEDDDDNPEEEIFNDGADDIESIDKDQEEEHEDYSRETIRLSDGNKEILLSSSQCNINELKGVIFEMLQQKDIREFLRLDNNKTSSSYCG